MDPPVVIIGAGLAGLSCALTFEKNQQSYLLLEKSNEVGGRVRTSQGNDCFLLDQGFQVLLTSYPELQHFLDLEKLDLQYFNSGALIYTPEKIRLLANPLRHPGQFLRETFSQVISLKDKSLVVKFILGIHTDAFETGRTVSTLSFLKSFGFSDEFIELFWRPFCAGIFLDKNLEVDSDFFIFLIKNFSTGRVAVPKKGMQEIPLQMSRKLDSTRIKLCVAVKEFSENRVVLTDGQEIQAKAVVCAFDPIVPPKTEGECERYRSVTNYYFSTKDSLSWGKWLLLVPPQYGFYVNNISVISDVSSAYSCDNQKLLSVSIIGPQDPGEAIVANELKQIANFDLKLEFIKKFKIEKALPKNYNNEQSVFKNGIYFCGDHLSSPSINGALKSGRLTAEEILALN